MYLTAQMLPHQPRQLPDLNVYHALLRVFLRLSIINSS